MIIEEGVRFADFGLGARLISEEDAPFIVSLRSDPNRTRYMIQLDPDVEKQKAWIREYKKRERQGKDYYFLYMDANDTPIGLDRISNIDYLNSSCKDSSWIKRRGSASEAMAMFLFHRKIIFDVLKMNCFFVDIHKENQSALRYYAGLEMCRYKEEAGFYYYKVDKANYLRCYSQVIDEFRKNNPS